MKWVTLTPWLSFRFEQKWNDLWFGAYWNKTGYRYDVWICIIPTLPIHISYKSVI